MTTELNCANCGGTNIRAWYTVTEGQGIALYGVRDDGSVDFEYDGDTTTGECGPDTEYACRDCGAEAESLEELVGLPPLPPTYKTEVFDSEGTLAIQFANGQDVAHLVWVDKTTATDDAAEPDWRELSDAERQSIIDRVAEVIR